MKNNQKTIFKKSVLQGGARLLTESHPYSRSFSVGFWIDIGSRFEPDGLFGITHFLEHLTFKGTKNRSAWEIAQSLESVGGDLNAFTSKEHTCFHALVLKDDWKKSLEILIDITTNMRFSEKDLKNEKGVVVQEIAMSEDTAEDIIYDYLLQDLFKGHPVSQPILGSIKSVLQLKKEEIYNYYQNFYHGSNLIISCAGNLEHEKIEGYLNKYLPTIQMNLSPKKTLEKNMYGVLRPEFKKVKTLKNKSHCEQTHILLALPSSSFKDRLRMEAFVVNSVLGGGMTSRLFQSVREKKGLAYSIHSSLNTLSDIGFMTIASSCESKKVKELIGLVHEEIKKLRKKGLTKDDVLFFKNQIKGSVLLGSEDIENRMNSLAINELVFQKPHSVEKIQKEIEKINNDSIHEYIEQFIHEDNISGIILGHEVEKEFKWWKN